MYHSFGIILVYGAAVQQREFIPSPIVNILCQISPVTTTFLEAFIVAGVKEHRLFKEFIPRIYFCLFADKVLVKISAHYCTIEG